ncbi:hypothetical protein FNF31_05111 [Cafeteria roenbergensis]|uniref:Uncharacterized protein n=1 Tax=Cafeteria roenbergensis TaxID=33653 RepID=A0A5A8D4T3_CAFRO|nr:hypothetical protein FNF31_05111 [Cafeteria roenbergensis]KAA0165169.1 hypothetical protein FNF28_03568 [Cafeteria roenbergensis]
MYADRCLQCSAQSKVQWGCPDTLPIASCSNIPGGAVLETTACAPLVRSVSSSLSQYGTDAAGVCVEFMATENLAFPNTKSLETLAEAELGPGLLLITRSEAAATQTLLGTACTNATEARLDLVAEGPVCYNTPLSVSARGLLVPGMAVFVFVFMLQAFVIMILGGLICILRDVRGHQWVRLTSVTKCSVCSAKCLPLVVRGINVLLVVILVGANAFIFGVGVCNNATNAAGKFEFFAAATTLLMVANALVWPLCCFGGMLRSAIHRDAAAATPANKRDEDPRSCTLLDCGCLVLLWRVIVRLSLRLGPA